MDAAYMSWLECDKSLQGLTMPEARVAARYYRFGDFSVDAAKRLLTRRGSRIPVTPKAFDVLLLLVQRHGEIVSKDALIREVWANSVVEETSLTRNISVLRKLLGETPDEHSYIVTVPGTGYRFVAAVEMDAPPADARDRPEFAAAEAGKRPYQPAAPTRIIVLPFRVLRPDPDTDFLAFSLPDAITSSLSGLQSVVVRSSRTASRLAETLTDMKTIARSADVDAVVTGTLLRLGDHIRVTTELCDADSSTVLWSSAAQWPLSHVFQLHDGIVRRVIESLSLGLSSREQRLLRNDVPATARAYECYLRANQLSQRRDQMRLACSLYNECLAEDPGYAPAWARIGRCYRVLGKYGVDSEQNLGKAEQAFQRALDLNPDLSLAHNLYAHLEAERGRAEDAMVRLLDRVRTWSNDPELFAGLVYVCRYCGLLDESAAAYTRARHLDPDVATTAGHTFLMMGQYERVLEITGDDTWFVDSLALSALGRSPEALGRLRIVEQHQLLPVVRAVLTSVRALFENKRDEAVAATRVFADQLADPEASFYAARNFVVLGEKADGLRLLRNAVERGFFSWPTLMHDSWLDPLRSDPDFRALMATARQRHQSARAAFDRYGGSALFDGIVSSRPFPSRPEHGGEVSVSIPCRRLPDM
jgi:DNA-binding winged helix-turn-helix (wHTH) protein/tetratricopeptide (TPR) repeat protein